MRAACSRCRRRRADVLYSAFNPDGSLRPLCADCEKIEGENIQPILIELPKAERADDEPETPSLFDPCAQLALFGGF